MKNDDDKIPESIENMARKAANKYNLDYDDLHQEGWVAYLEFLPQRDTLEPEQFFHTALKRIRDRITNYCKKAIRESNKTSTMTDHVARNPGFDPEGNDYSYGEKAKLVLSILPDRDRKIMEMYFVESYTQQEISEKLNIPQRTLSDIISRSIKKLKS